MRHNLLEALKEGLPARPRQVHPSCVLYIVTQPRTWVLTLAPEAAVLQTAGVCYQPKVSDLILLASTFALGDDMDTADDLVQVYKDHQILFQLANNRTLLTSKIEKVKWGL